MSARQVLGRLRESMGRMNDAPGGWEWFAANVVVDAVADYDEALDGKVPLAYLPRKGKKWWSFEEQSKYTGTVIRECLDFFASSAFDNYCDLAGTGYEPDLILEELGLKYQYVGAR